jgi:hypothetical protein
MGTEDGVQGTLHAIGPKRKMPGGWGQRGCEKIDLCPIKAASVACTRGHSDDSLDFFTTSASPNQETVGRAHPTAVARSSVPSRLRAEFRGIPGTPYLIPPHRRAPCWPVESWSRRSRRPCLRKGDFPAAGQAFTNGNGSSYAMQIPFNCRSSWNIQASRSVL